MSTSSDHALVSGGGPNRRIELKRVIRAPIRKVWDAITDPEQVKQWWGAGTVEAREGGRVCLQGDGECDPDAPSLDGRVKVCLPPHVFEFTWNEAYDPAEGLVRFDLIELDEATTLVTLVNVVPDSDRTAAAIGWHVLMDRLRDVVHGEVPVPEAERTEELSKVYADVS